MILVQPKANATFYKPVLKTYAYLVRLPDIMYSYADFRCRDGGTSTEVMLE